ncbi:MAG: hypothetical protein KAU14_06940 [Thermoplasmata archaeon]|nr:hypothetical protein [Thermoplasmata archaeon]
MPMLILASEKDPAARNIRDHLLELWDHEEAGEYHKLPIFRGGEITLASLPVSALKLDLPDTSIPLKAGRPGVVVYLSRHQSASKRRTLTVHPIGNFGTAEFGGKGRKLVPSAPHIMSTALRFLNEKEAGGFECTFEATHHGPYLEAPTFFIEIGSTLEEWNNPKAIRAVAEAMLETIEVYEKGNILEGKVCIGFGGGHYAPRHTKHALSKGLDFGHIIPSYALKNLDDELAEEMVRKTPGVEQVCVHGKKLRKEVRVFEGLGLEVREY